MKTIILPQENQADFETLPAKIKASITVHYAETFQDIYNIAFESESFSECCITVNSGANYDEKKENEKQKEANGSILCQTDRPMEATSILDRHIAVKMSNSDNSDLEFDWGDELTA